MKLAIIHKEKCKSTICGNECKKCCPVEKKESGSCVNIDSTAHIDENTCVGCAICVKRCPFGAIDIINLPSVSEKDIVYRYGDNGFTLYGLPTPKSGLVLGLLGRNGIGKTTAIKILAGVERLNLGKPKVTDDEIKKFFRGNELLKYLEKIGYGNQSNPKIKISYKPQSLSQFIVDIKVIDLLRKRGSDDEIKKLAKQLDVSQILNNKMDKISGGELQKIVILAASLVNSDVYFFDEPLAFLDIEERLRVSDFLRKIATGKNISTNSEKENKTLIVVEHDLLILDYLTDNLNIFFGGQGAFGTVSGLKTSKVGVNAYLNGFLKEENIRIRSKPLSFNFTKNPAMSGNKIAEWPSFDLKFNSDFMMSVEAGEIHENHVIAILGKNGTGKTTFVRALAGEIETSKGKLDLNLKISYKPQYLVAKSDEVVRNIMFKEKINKKLASVFNLGVLAGKKINELSGGELQRLSVARCLSKDADIYLIDEPSAYLDVEERIAVAKIIKDIMTEKGKTAFVVDHDLLLVSYLADSVINFSGIPGKTGVASEVRNFETGIGELLKSIGITLRKDKDSGRPRINKKGSVLDREQKEKNRWVIL